MSASFYFYDLETTGINSRSGRIMQFGGQRTDMNLKPTGEPDNILVKLSDDTLPEPDAIMITGITPQATQTEGITEAEFLKYFQSHICAQDTIFVGFNNVRFDDEFIRHTLYRNFYDAYEWCWQDKRGRWDLLDVVRMMRALRPDGITWPVGPDGKASNRLELLTSANNLDHTAAHDALSDVNATIAVARLLRNKQTKMFDYLLSMRDKKKVQELVNGGQPFVYTSGKYPSAYEKTTVVQTLGDHPGKQGVLVYDLRRDPGFLENMSPEEIATLWQLREEDETKRFPIKTLQFNRCPAVAPLGVLNDENKERLKIDMDAISANRAALNKIKDLRERLLKAIAIMDKLRQATFLTDIKDVDNQLYDGFFNDGDKTAMAVVRAAEKSEISSLHLTFKDGRLNTLFPLYKARNYPQSLSQEEREIWEKFRFNKLVGGGDKSALSKYFMRISEIAKRPGLTSAQQYLLEELQLYGESIMPEPLDMDE
ncbi:MAG: Exodeoxyribonuclease [Candidatus Saccharibacteria bacterium]|nr:Exodeoxyribonuclease [Candidatus Saccharibacteria bacterium]